MLDENTLVEVTRIVGPDNIDQERVDDLFRGDADTSGLVLVRPGSSDELQDLVVLAADRGIPIFTVRSRYVSHTIAGKEGFLVDISRMDKIIGIDEKNMKARVQAGVTYDSLISALEAEGMRLLLPVSAVSESALRSNLDRDVTLGAAGLRFSNLSVFYAVLGNGEVWASGSLQLGQEGRPDFGEDQGPQLSGAFRASEDIFGIPYQATLYIYPKYADRAVLLAGFDSMEGALELVKTVSRNEHCFQCAAADSVYWGALTGTTPEECGKNADLFAPWTVVMSLEHERPLVELWKDMVAREVADAGGRLIDGEAVGLAGEALSRPWYRWDHDTLRGDSHAVHYYCYPRSAPGFFETVGEKIAGFETGRVVVPIHFGGSFFCETVVYCDGPGFAQAGEPAFDAYMALIERGALVDHPTGRLAPAVFEKADPAFVELVKTLKGLWDPQGILNPGELLRGV